MPRYRVQLTSVDREDDAKDVLFDTVIEASDKDDAKSKAMDVQKLERPDIQFGSTWSWFVYETAGK